MHACLDAFDDMLDAAARSKGLAHSGPKWPANLILGEGKQSRVGNGEVERPEGAKSRAGNDTVSELQACELARAQWIRA